ncbi:phosphatase PAP2 family protein [Catenovulum sp. SM1970]|uniref:phosphatase PAP2 family protein n=1 Tax=Marinifaba aquimaris TaxID=2741323 RepID=UPI0015741563|nr:phosphatase PAP2 family protein [Marinifaba aquimaris]NTS77226.1 phosphatase PAP2 family protein [Marinifaba aquimaris]
MNFLAATDSQLFTWLFSHTKNRSITWVRLVSKTGDGHLYIALAVLLLLIAEQGQNFLVLGLLAFAIELPLYFVLKRSLKRVRPSDAIISAHITPSDKFSLPSGHTAAAFVMAFTLSHFYPVLAPYLYAWASLVGLSRVLLGVHYPGDIIAGACLGLASASLAVNLVS